ATDDCYRDDHHVRAPDRERRGGGARGQLARRPRPGRAAASSGAGRAWCVVLPDRAPVTDEEFRSFGSLFGKAFVYPYRRGPGREVGALDFDDGMAAAQGLVSRWHTDGTPMASPPYAALLTPSVLPSVGGDTIWASMTAAFDALSSHYQRLLEGME